MDRHRRQRCYRSEILINVPRHARYAVHKLIVATHRASSAAVKAMKDIEQSATLIRVLAEDRPDELEDAFVEACARGPSWKEAVDRGTRRLPRDVRAAFGNAVTQDVRK